MGERAIFRCTAATINLRECLGVSPRSCVSRQKAIFLVPNSGVYVLLGGQVRGTGRDREQICPAEALFQTIHHLLAYLVLFREVTPSLQREWKTDRMYHM